MGLLKKSKTTFIIILCALVFLMVLVGGYIWMKYEEKEAFLNKQEQRITEFFRYNVPEYKSIKFTYKRSVPTGDLFIHGYINGDRSLAFSAQISLGGGQRNFEGDVSCSDHLDKMFKHENTVSTIEKIKKEQKAKKGSK